MQLAESYNIMHMECLNDLSDFFCVCRHILSLSISSRIFPSQQFLNLSALESAPPRFSHWNFKPPLWNLNTGTTSNLWRLKEPWDGKAGRNSRITKRGRKNIHSRGDVCSRCLTPSTNHLAQTFIPSHGVLPQRGCWLGRQLHPSQNMLCLSRALLARILFFQVYADPHGRTQWHLVDRDCQPRVLVPAAKWCGFEA